MTLLVAIIIAHTDMIVVAVVGAMYGIRRVRERHDRPKYGGV